MTTLNINEKNTSALKNKFQSAEENLNNDLKFKLDEKAFNALKVDTGYSKEKKTQKQNIFVKSFVIVGKLLIEMKNFILKEFLIPLSGYLKAKAISVVSNLKTNAEQSEIKLSEYLDEVDRKITHKKNTDEKMIENDPAIKNYELVVSRLFNNLLCNCSVDSDLLDFKNSKMSISQSTENIKLINKKLLESKLDKNIDLVTVNTTVEKSTITQAIEFELKSSGALWGTIFSKYICSDLIKILSNFEGSVEGFHQNNVTQKKETFTILISYKKVEIVNALKTMNELESKLNKIESLINQDL